MKKSFLLMHLAILLWGFTGIFGKAISLTADVLVWYRMLFTSISLAAIILIQRKLFFIQRKDWWRISVVGFFVAVHWVLFYAAIKASNVSIALGCFSSLALFTSIIEPLTERQKPRLPEMILGLFVILGIWIIFSVQKLYLTGIIFSVLSAFFASCFTVMNKYLVKRNDATVLSFYEMTTGFFFLSVILQFSLSYYGNEFSFPGNEDLFYLILLSTFCTAFAFTIGNMALRKLDAFTLNLSVNLEPVYSIVLAILIFKEDKMLNTGFYLGTLIILSSVFIHSYFHYRKHKA